MLLENYIFVGFLSQKFPGRTGEMSDNAVFLANLLEKNIVANFPRPKSIAFSEWQQVKESEILNCENSIILIDEVSQLFNKESLLSIRLRGNRLLWSAQNLESVDPKIQNLTEALCFLTEVNGRLEKYYLSQTNSYQNLGMSRSEPRMNQLVRGSKFSKNNIGRDCSTF